MSRFGTQYQVSRPTGVCAASGAPLEPGSVCVATLCERPEDEGFDRKDFSLDAWESGDRPDHLFSFWRTTVSHPDAKRRMLVDDETLMELFQRLADEEQPQRVAFRFVLALILMRKRRLKFVGRRSAGGGEGVTTGAGSRTGTGTGSSKGPRTRKGRPVSGAAKGGAANGGAAKGGAVTSQAADAPAEEVATEYWQLRASADDPIIDVINPQLSDDDVRELTSQLSEILQGEL